VLPSRKVVEVEDEGEDDEEDVSKDAVVSNEDDVEDVEVFEDREEDDVEDHRILEEVEDGGMYLKQ